MKTVQHTKTNFAWIVPAEIVKKLNLQKGTELNYKINPNNSVTLTLK